MADLAEAPEDMTVRTGTPDDVDRCLQVLRDAYDRAKFGRDWYEWKHLEGPWGPSRLILAEEESGLLGVVFALPWPYRVDGERVEGTRFVDGGTLPAARGRRVLSILCADELRRWGPDRPGVLLATATPAAQRSHARNGAATLEPIVSAYGLPRSLRRARLVHGLDLLDGYEPSPGPAIATDWDPAALRWRLDPRSDRTYGVSSLPSGDGPNGLAYQVARDGRVPTLVPVISWGSERDRTRLLGAVAWHERTPVVLAPTGPSVPDARMRALRPGGSTVMCVWDLRDHPRRTATDGTNWCLTQADIAGLI